MRRVVLLLATLLIAGGGLLGSAAQAASQPIGLSWDGHDWGTELTGGLQDGPRAIRHWVPGDAQTRQFYVRNQGGSDASLIIDYTLPHHPLLDAGDFRLTAQVGGGSSVPLAPGANQVVLERAGMADSRVVTVRISGAFDQASTNPTQNQRFGVEFHIRLTQATAEDDADTNGDGRADADNGGRLPNTGAPEIRWPLLLAALFLGGGTVAIVAARRKEDDDEVA